MYQKEVNDLRDEITRDLRFSARSYYNIGMGVFYESSTKSWVDFQPAIGNLSISVELLLKAVVAQKALRMLYSNLPDEAQLLLCYPDSLTKEHNATSYISDLKSFSFKTIELDKSVSLFYHFYPDMKQEYKQFFSSLSSVRNVSVHASLPGFQRYELERIAYFSTRLFVAVSELEIFKYFTMSIDAKTENFLEYYKDEKVKKVHAALNRARSVVKQGKLAQPGHGSADWETMNMDCPICENPAFLHGETEERNDEGGIELTFQCESFSCEACSLELEDFEELELAGIELSIDRSEDSDQWLEDHHCYED